MSHVNTVQAALIREINKREAETARQVEVLGHHAEGSVTFRLFADRASKAMAEHEALMKVADRMRQPGNKLHMWT
jgi:hypothetical protein